MALLFPAKRNFSSIKSVRRSYLLGAVHARLSWLYNRNYQWKKPLYGKLWKYKKVAMY